MKQDEQTEDIDCKCKGEKLAQKTQDDIFIIFRFVFMHTRNRNLHLMERTEIL